MFFTFSFFLSSMKCCVCLVPLLYNKQQRLRCNILKLEFCNPGWTRMKWSCEAPRYNKGCYIIILSLWLGVESVLQVELFVCDGSRHCWKTKDFFLVRFCQVLKVKWSMELNFYCTGALLAAFRFVTIAATVFNIRVERVPYFYPTFFTSYIFTSCKECLCAVISIYKGM